MLPIIFGCRSTRLNASEREFFQQVNPAGFILFARNIDNPQQVKALTAELRAVSEAGKPREHTAILIDQEGGVVQRLRPPNWRGFPSAKSFGELWQRQGASIATRTCRESARLMGEELANLGITIDCAPVADLPSPDADQVVGTRAFGQSLEYVTSLARAQAEGLLDAGIVPIVKHVPGHGRAKCDSHKALPIVEQTREQLLVSDFACFAKLKDLPIMMTAHVCYREFDNALPATISQETLQKAVREDIGFRGLLVSDDLAMKSLQGNLGERAIAAIRAGCNLALYCGFNLAIMREISEACSAVSLGVRENTEATLNDALALAAKRKKIFTQKERQCAENYLLAMQTQGSPSHATAMGSTALDPTAV